jgi:hypothetical protein
MTKDRLAHAVRRLDQALARVEAASQRASSSPSPGFAQLQQRHERLRARTQDAIGALDRLIGA